MKLSQKSLYSQLSKLLEKNLSTDNAEQLADYFVWAEMSGNKTQGIVKFTGPDPVQNIVPAGEIETMKETAVSAALNANSNPAPLASIEATRVAIEKARSSGVGVVTLRNFYSSNGAQGYYAEMMARSGLIGLCVSRSPAAQAGFGSVVPIFGTNPIGFAFPTNGDPVVFDMATSAMTFYGLVLAKARGEKLPDDVAIDSDGNPTNDPAMAIKGALLPFDRSYKGSELALLVELLAGPLAGSAWIDNQTLTEEWGAFFLAIDPEILLDRETFLANSSDMIEKIRHAKTHESIRLPGESSTAKRRANEASGIVEIDDVIARQLGITAD